MNRSRHTLVAAVVLGLVGGALVAPSTTAGAVGTPAHISIESITTSSFTVKMPRPAGAKTFRICVARKPGYVSVARINSAKCSAKTDSTTITMRALRTSPEPYYYRIAAYRGSDVRYSSIRQIYLRPKTPSDLTTRTDGLAAAAAGPQPLALTWDAGSASRFEIQASTDATFQSDIRSFTSRGPTHTFTPYGLTGGATYNFRVRAANADVTTKWSNTATGRVGTDAAPLRLLTYNLLRADKDGTREGDGTIAPWSKRKDAATSLIKSVDPDVLTLQEAGSWTGAERGPRQVDSLVSALGSDAYALALTEIPPDQPHYHRTARYIVYRKAALRTLGEGGNWELSKGTYAAYQTFEHRDTGAHVVVVSVHLTVGRGRALDETRMDEMAKALNRAAVLGAQYDASVVFAGDFNSYPGKAHPLDGPGKVMTSAGYVDAEHASPTRVNVKYNSANGYFRRAPKHGLHLDHIYLQPGVAVTKWRMLLKLSGGKFTGTIPSDHNPLVADLLLPY